MAQVNGNNNINSVSSQEQQNRIDQNESRTEFFDRLKKMSEREKKRRRSTAADEAVAQLANMWVQQQSASPLLKGGMTLAQLTESSADFPEYTDSTNEGHVASKNVLSEKIASALAALEVSKLQSANAEGKMLDGMKHSISNAFDSAATAGMAMAGLKKANVEGDAALKKANVEGDAALKKVNVEMDAAAAAANMSLQQALLTHRASELFQPAPTPNAQPQLYDQAQTLAFNQPNQAQVASNAVSSNLIYRFNKWNSSGTASVSVDMKVGETGEMSAILTPSNSDVGQRLNASLPMTADGGRWRIEGDAQHNTSARANDDEDEQG